MSCKTNDDPRCEMCPLKHADKLVNLIDSDSDLSTELFAYISNNEGLVLRESPNDEVLLRQQLLNKLHTALLRGGYNCEPELDKDGDPHCPSFSVAMVAVGKSIAINSDEAHVYRRGPFNRLSGLMGMAANDQVNEGAPEGESGATTGQYL